MLIGGWRFVTLLLVALLTGLAFAHVLERPGKLTYDSATYITVQKTLYLAWGPGHIGGMLEPAAIIATVGLTVIVRRRRIVFWLTLAAAVALLLAFPVTFLSLVEPVNRVFLNASPSVPPANWTVLRDQWDFGHAIRFALQAVALSVLLVSVLIDRDPGPMPAAPRE